MIFDGHDPAYDLLIGLLLVGIPLILQFFYFRAMKHFQEKQNRRIAQEKAEKERIIKEMQEFAIKVTEDVKKQKEKVHEEMMAKFEKGIQQVKDEMLEKFKSENESTSIMINKMTEANSHLQRLNEELSSKVNISDTEIDEIQEQISTLEINVDEIYDEIKGQKLTPRQKRERILNRRKKSNKKRED